MKLNYSIYYHHFFVLSPTLPRSLSRSFAKASIVMESGDCRQAISGDDKWMEYREFSESTVVR